MEKIEIQIKHRFTGNIIFKYESENNTIKDTLKNAIKQGIGLRDADLRGADLQGTDLQGANLRYTDLRGANLRGTYLQDAGLQGANLRYTNLQGTYLQDADLRGAGLLGADLRDAGLLGADLRGANLRGADLRGAGLLDANLQGTNLRYTDLRDADLRDANLRGADLRYTDLRDADFRGADLHKKDIEDIKHQIWLIPEEGSFVAWKKINSNLIVKLEILDGAKRTCNIKNRKCRASKVRVLEITNCKGEKVKEGVGSHDMKTKYITGKITKADYFDDDIRQDCTHGIHFWITKQEALNW